MNKKNYAAIFFDLDHTLWDYDSNSRETLAELFEKHLGNSSNLKFDDFHDTFQSVNLSLWDQYDRGLIHRDVIRFNRFEMVLNRLEVDNINLASRLSEDYLAISPTKKNLVVHTREVLEHLSGKYPLYLVTNGFELMQFTKVKSGGIEKYFKAIVTSETAGHKKPARGIFDYTCGLANVTSAEVVMIGDNLLTDMAGASSAGIDSIFFNPKQEQHEATVTYEINSLRQLMDIL